MMTLIWIWIWSLLKFGMPQMTKCSLMEDEIRRFCADCRGMSKAFKLLSRCYENYACSIQKVLVHHMGTCCLKSTGFYHQLTHTFIRKQKKTFCHKINNVLCRSLQELKNTERRRQLTLLSSWLAFSNCQLQTEKSRAKCHWTQVTSHQHTQHDTVSTHCTFIFNKHLIFSD